MRSGLLARVRASLAGLCLGVAIGVRLDAQAAQAGAASADAIVAQGVTALHHFEYEEANEAFRRAQQLDPAAVLAYWGEALTYHQALWRKESIEAARQALGRLAPTPAARAAKARNALERGLIGAVDVLFGEGDRPTRLKRYQSAMSVLHDQLPDDADVTTLYALSLMSEASRGLIGSGDAPPGGNGLAGSDAQKQVAALLEAVLKAQPRHPGALHYLIHDYDDPEHARLALDAARTYASVAAGASHALHMPAHIFLQLGLWHDAAASDRAAYDASRSWVERKKLAPALRNFHALSWLQYELLQLGRYAEARDTIDEIEPVVKASGALAPGAHDGAHQPLLSDLSSMRARYAIETRQWNVLAGQTTFGNVNELFAIGMSAARTGNLRSAQTVRQALAERATSAQEGDLRPAIAIMEREMAALIEQAGGQNDAAIAILRDAARAELNLPPPLGLPAPIKPAPELLGELLLETGKPAEASVQFEQTLARHANRTLSVVGLQQARTALEAAKPPSTRAPLAALAVITIAGLATMGLAWRRRKRAPAQGTQRIRRTQRKTR